MHRRRNRAKLEETFGGSAHCAYGRGAIERPCTPAAPEVTILDERIGFIGLGIMGRPMAGHLVDAGYAVTVWNRTRSKMTPLLERGAAAAESPRDVAARSDIVITMVADTPDVRAVILGPEGVLHGVRPGSIVVDMSTISPAATQEIAGQIEARGAVMLDAPVSGGEKGAIDGTLSIMVGATDETFARIAPLLRTMASEVTHCGEAGAGQAVKILNNMILFQTGVALAEALSIARANGVDGKVLFETLTKGSADSFALRNHGMKAMLPGVFPERAFSTVYALKDLSYAIQMAEEAGVPALGADVARELMERAKELGFDKEYWPVLIKAIEDGKS